MKENTVNNTSSVSKRAFNSITYLRVIAMFMIAYDHLGPFLYNDWVVGKIISFFINKPLYIIQHFGAYGVSIFFLISGFLFYGKQISLLDMLRKKVLRIVLPLVGAMLLQFCFLNVMETFGIHHYWEQFAIKDWIETTTLFSWFLGKANYLNGTLWYLIPFLTFTVLAAIIAPLIEKRKYTLAVLSYSGTLYCVAKAIPNISSIVFFAIMPMFGILLRCYFEEQITGKKVAFFMSYIYGNHV